MSAGKSALVVPPVPDRAKAAIRASGLSQREVAARLGWHRTTLVKRLNGDNIWTIPQAAAFIRVLRTAGLPTLTYDDVFGLTEIETTNGDTHATD